jgi:acetoin:2,6-dichlorophenolindophenol oxidoreductase subunit beta
MTTTIKTTLEDEKLSTAGLMTYRDAILQTTRQAMSDRPEIIILGQGANDFKGIFGSTRGLVEEFGEERVLDMPLAEEGMTGIALGAALNGLYPIITHIRTDFSLVAMNQMINLVAKYKYMFGGRFEVPMLIRMIIGRSWGQGAQHSQSPQSLFAHHPGLTVVMPSNAQSILESYPFFMSDYHSPVISIEHRLLYDINFHVNEPASATRDQILTSHQVREGKDITIVATSVMVLEATRAANHLAEVSDIDCEIIDLNCVSHPDKEMILNSVAKTGRLLIADTSWQAYGVSAEICRIVCEHNPSALKSPVVTMGMQPSPCPTAKALEDMFYPNLQTLTDAIARLVKGKTDHAVPLPSETSYADIYKRFKGPF